MSIDRYYILLEGKFVHCFPDVNLSDFWVDICHGANFLVDERYYFSNLSSALDFYLDGWRNRQFLDDDRNDVGLDHSGLYSGGRLIQGLSIHGDAPGHEGENLCRILGAFVEKLDDDERP